MSILISFAALFWTFDRPTIYLGNVYTVVYNTSWFPISMITRDHVILLQTASILPDRMTTDLDPPIQTTSFLRMFPTAFGRTITISFTIIGPSDDVVLNAFVANTLKTTILL